MRTTSQMQHRQAFRGALKFDPKGRYTLQAMAGCGSSFTGSWENAGPGTGDGNLSFARPPPLRVGRADQGPRAPGRRSRPGPRRVDRDHQLRQRRLHHRRARQRPSQPTRFYLDEICVSVGYLGDSRDAERLRAADRLVGPQLHAGCSPASSSARARPLSVDWTGARRRRHLAPGRSRRHERDPRRRRACVSSSISAPARPCRGLRRHRRACC